MKSWVKKNNLQRYLQKLENVSKINIAETTASILVEKGVEYAQQEYAGSKHTNVEGEVKDTNGTITASREASSKSYRDGLMYIEYGTGLVGKGTYEGELPTSGVPITGNWEYYYDSPHKKNGGWYLKNGVFTRGRVAGNQMYRTAKSLKEYIANGELKDDLRKEIRK